MNANELADLIELCGDGGHNQSAAKMLRAQEDLINCLRMGQPNIDYDKELLKPTFVGRELTDEEITEVIKKIASNNEYVYSLYEDFEGIEFSRVGIFDFARAILRKANEK